MREKLLRTQKLFLWVDYLFKYDISIFIFNKFKFYLHLFLKWVTRPTITRLKNYNEKDFYDLT